jgi:orotate phosphoribosyltransferase
VRKTRKQHGTGALVECSPPPGRKAVLVDDLMASGGSLDLAIDAIEHECRMEPCGIVTIVNWNFHVMRERFAQRGVPFHSLVSYPELLQAGMQGGRLTKPAALELARFYRNPKNHEWDFSAFAEDVKGQSA